MSKLQELVEAEARAAESEPDPDAEGGTAGEEAVAPAELEAAAPALPFDPKKVEAELRRHEREMAKLLGDSWSEMRVCEPCGGAGFVPSDYTPPPEIVADPFAVACPECNGYGLRATPSLREGNMLVTCDPCGGAGWRDRRQLEAMQAAQAYQQPAAYAPPPGQPAWNPTTQRWETAGGQPAFAPPPPPPATPPSS